MPRTVADPAQDEILKGMADDSGCWRRLLLHPARKIAVLVSAGNPNEPIRWNDEAHTSGMNIPVAPIEVRYDAACELIRNGTLSVRCEGDGWKYYTFTQ